VLELQEGFRFVSKDDSHITLLAALDRLHGENRFPELGLKLLAYENCITTIEFLLRTASMMIVFSIPPKRFLRECMNPFS
jgi:hypothetical protein